jgi:single-stranded DNA-specific DHH superfamily exonuclease
MLTKKQIEEIREHLEKAQNPIFYYDNDADGLCAFLLLRRYLGRGYGVAIRSYPGLDASYLRKAEQLKADYIFVLDKPLIAKEFIEEADSMQLPLVWIEHHEITQAEISENAPNQKNFHYYNPALNISETAIKVHMNEPTSYLSYKIAERKEDVWIALLGCIADCYLPDFAEEFGKRYSEFWGKDVKGPFDVYYKTEIGRIALSLNFGLKDSISHVVQLQNFLISCKSPSDVFLELETNKAFREKYREIAKKYEVLLKGAKESESQKIVYLIYGGDLSISSDLANNLSYLYPEKYICVAFKKGTITNLSLRGKKIRPILEKILKKLENARGGGHENAVGATIQAEDLEKFKEFLEQEIK